MWLAAALLLALAGCATHHPTGPAVPVDTGPLANSPTNVIRRFAWAWTHRDTTTYASVFTDDFRFVFAASDSAGSFWPGHAWNIPDEMQSAGHLFVGGGDVPPLSDVTLFIDNVLIAQLDPRPGHDGRWHKTVRTHVDLKLTATYDGTPAVDPVVGYAVFYVVRGDSAMLSPARVAAGGRDSTRWYIDRWEDQTVGTGSPGLHPNPTRATTWGSIKALYW
jgi:hypothetical protein